MEDQERDRPEIVTYRIPRFEVYWVSEDEIARIEEGSNQVAQDLAFALSCGSLCVAFVIALLTGTFRPGVGATLTIAAAVSGVAAAYTGARWWLRHRKAPSVIDSIRSRRVDPETPKPGGA